MVPSLQQPKVLNGYRVADQAASPLSANAGSVQQARATKAAASGSTQMRVGIGILIRIGKGCCKREVALVLSETSVKLVPTPELL